MAQCGWVLQKKWKKNKTRWYLGWHHLIWPKWSKFLLDLEPQTWVKFHKRFRNASRFVVCTWPLLPKATVQWSCINYSKMIHWYTKVHTNWNETYLLTYSGASKETQTKTQHKNKNATPLNGRARVELCFEAQRWGLKCRPLEFVFASWYLSGKTDKMLPEWMQQTLRKQTQRSAPISESALRTQ